MDDWKPRAGGLIQRLYAWVAVEEDGGEGIIAASTVVDGAPVIMPLVGADRAAVEMERPLALHIGQKSGRPVRLVEFASRIVLERAP